MSKVIISITLILLALCWGIYFTQTDPGAGVMVLHFSNERGIDFLGSRADFLGILILFSGIILMNLGLARAFSGRDMFISRLFYFATALIALLLLIALAVIVSIN